MHMKRIERPAKTHQLREASLVEAGLPESVKPALQISSELLGRQVRRRDAGGGIRGGRGGGGARRGGGRLLLSAEEALDVSPRGAVLLSCPVGGGLQTRKQFRADLQGACKWAAWRGNFRAPMKKTSLQRVAGRGRREQRICWACQRGRFSRGHALNVDSYRASILFCTSMSFCSAAVMASPVDSWVCDTPWAIEVQSEWPHRVQYAC